MLAIHIHNKKSGSDNFEIYFNRISKNLIHEKEFKRNCEEIMLVQDLRYEISQYDEIMIIIDDRFHHEIIKECFVNVPYNKANNATIFTGDLAKFVLANIPKQFFDIFEKIAKENKLCHYEENTYSGGK